MPTAKLTDRSVKALPNTKTGQVYYSIDGYPKLGLLVGTTSKTFCFRTKKEGGGQRVTIGRFPDYSVDDVRKRFKQLAADDANDRMPSRGVTLEDALVAYLRDRRDRKDWKPDGEATANDVMRKLRVIHNHAMATDPALPDNSTLALSRQHSWFANRMRKDHIAPSDLAAWYAGLTKLRAINLTCADCLLFVLFTGMRRQEAAELYWAEVDPARMQIAVPAARIKTRRNLRLPMSRQVEELLRDRPRVDGSDYVFAVKGGKTHRGPLVPISARRWRPCAPTTRRSSPTLTATPARRSLARGTSRRRR